MLQSWVELSTTAEQAMSDTMSANDSDRERDDNECNSEFTGGKAAEAAALASPESEEKAIADEVEAMPCARGGHSMVRISEDQLVLFGGNDLREVCSARRPQRCAPACLRDR